MAVGRIRYHHAPGAPFNPERGRDAARFVDSAAALLSVDLPIRIDYYLTPSFEAMNRLQGFDWLLSRTATGGRAFPENGIVLSGDSRHGEAYLHELAHVVLEAFGPARDRHMMSEEGVATWLGGGSRAPDFASYLSLLVAFQEANPAAGFRDVLRLLGSGNDAPYYGTGALVADYLFHANGRRGVERLLRVGRSDQELLAALPELLGINADSLDSWWRSQPRRRFR